MKNSFHILLNITKFFFVCWRWTLKYYFQFFSHLSSHLLGHSSNIQLFSVTFQSKLLSTFHTMFCKTSIPAPQTIQNTQGRLHTFNCDTFQSQADAHTFLITVILIWNWSNVSLLSTIRLLTSPKVSTFQKSANIKVTKEQQSIIFWITNISVNVNNEHTVYLSNPDAHLAEQTEEISRSWGANAVYKWIRDRDTFGSEKGWWVQETITSVTGMEI